MVLRLDSLLRMRSSQSHTKFHLSEIVVLVNCRRTNQDAMTHSGHITFPSSSPTCLLYSITIWHQKVARTESTQSKVKKGSIKQCPTGFSSLSLDWMPTITGTINWIECDNNATGFCCSRIELSETAHWQRQTTLPSTGQQQKLFYTWNCRLPTDYPPESK